jgi:hypothetical protein
VSSRWIRRLIAIAIVLAAVYVAGFGAYGFTAGAHDAATNISSVMPVGYSR